MISFSVREKRYPRLRVFYASLWFLGFLLLPAILLALPVLVLACLAARISPMFMLRALARVVTALRGAHVQIEDRHRTYLIQIAEEAV